MKPTARQNCLELLILAYQVGNVRMVLYGKEQMAAVNGCVPNYAFNAPEVGGVQGGRRRRELSNPGGIEIERLDGYDGNGHKTGTVYYRLVTDPSLIDRKKCCLKAVQRGTHGGSPVESQLTLTIPR